MGKITTEDYIAKAKSIHGDYYGYQDTVYLGSKAVLLITCPIHGNYQQRADNHIQGKGCRLCCDNNAAQYKLSNTEEFINKANTIHNSLYGYDKVYYVASDTKVNIFCTVCNKYFSQTPNHHLKGMGCPTCQSSKGERKIRNYLIENDISFSEQWRNKTCKDKYTLPFDFYLPDYNLLIEFQGEQHYQFIPYIHRTIDKFESQQKRDKIKREWTKQNNIQLLEISYKELDIIDTVLSNVLIKDTICP